LTEDEPFREKKPTPPRDKIANSSCLVERHCYEILLAYNTRQFRHIFLKTDAMITNRYFHRQHVSSVSVNNDTW